MRSLTDGVIAVLKADGLTVGDAEGGLEPPFVVVYPLIQIRDGSHADGYSDVTKFFELVCEGTTREQSEWAADKAELAVARSALVVAEMTRVRTDRDDSTGSPSRFKTWTRLEIRAHAPTGA